MSFNRFISKKPCSVSGIGSKKYNESSEPNFDDLVDKCGGKFSKEELKKCELNVMEKLDNNLSIPTIFDLFQFIKIIKYLTEKEYYLVSLCSKCMLLMVEIWSIIQLLLLR